MEYEKGYLLSYINKKRIDKQNYIIIKDFTELDRLIKKEHIKGILRKTSELYEATLVKYCNFTFDRIILEE